MVNKGASPIDVNTPTGQLRLTVGDSASTPLNPVEPGFVDYAVWSDAALDAALLNASANVMRAAGMLYLQLAAEYAIKGRSVRTDDLALDDRGRGKDLREIAQSFFDSANGADLAASNDFFAIVPFGGRTEACHAEGSPWPHNCGYGCGCATTVVSTDSGGYGF